MKLRLLVACALAVSLVLFAGAVGAQLKEGKSAEDKAAKARGAQDPNIKVTRDKVEANDASKETPAPPHKGGAKSRGPSDCWVKYNNYTPWWIECYADGRYAGTVAPWGDFTANVGAGVTTLYARARFTGGSVSTWGPRVFACESDGYFTWNVRR